MTQRRIYQDEYPYFVTWRTREGYRLFEETKMAGLMADIMFNAAALKGCDILAYQIMPDHVHLLIYTDHILRARVSPPALTIHMEGRAPTERCARGNYHNVRSVTISEYMYTVKSYFVRQMRVQYNIDFRFFQKRFYARVVDTNKYLHTVVSYIINNPTKAKLPERFQRHPYQYINWEMMQGL